MSQIPSLLISLSTGILVTKASKEAEIGDQLFGELFSIPKVMFMVGGTMALLGIITPLNWYIFVPFGILLILAGITEFFLWRDSSFFFLIANECATCF